jgi:hypothetical protein
MESHQLLREVLQSGNAKEIASALGLSLSMVYKWAEPVGEGSGSGTSNPLDRVATLLKVTGDTRLVEWICQCAGGFYIKNPRLAAPHPSFLIPATNKIIQEFADLLGVIAAAAADNQVNQKEACQIRARWEDLKSVTEGFVRCCEEGNFLPLKNQEKGKEV